MASGTPSSQTELQQLTSITQPVPPPDTPDEGFHKNSMRFK
jgi:hypothetical protein